MNNQAWIWLSFDDNSGVSDVGVDVAYTSDEKVCIPNAGKFSYGGDSLSISSNGRTYYKGYFSDSISRVSDIGFRNTLNVTKRVYILGRVG